MNGILRRSAAVLLAASVASPSPAFAVALRAAAVERVPAVLPAASAAALASSPSALRSGASLALPSRAVTTAFTPPVPLPALDLRASVAPALRADEPVTGAAVTAAAPALRAVAAAVDAPERDRRDPTAVLDAFWDATKKRDKTAVEAFADLAVLRADAHGRVTPELQAALTRIENAHAAKFTRGARREWQTLLANLGAKTTLPIVTPPVAVPYWQKDGHPLSNYLSHFSLPRQADVVVIGAGLTGASAAYHLADEAKARGLKVVVLDAHDAVTQASGRNGGNFELIPENYQGSYAGLAMERAKMMRAVRPHATNEELKAEGERQARALLRFAARNREVLAGILEREKIKADYTPKGWVRAAVNAKEEAGLKAEVALARELGLDMRELTPAELDEALGVPAGTHKFGGRLSESDGNYHPFKYATAVLWKAIEKGVELYSRTPVTKITTLDDGTQLLETSRGRIRAKQIIIATNGFTADLLPELASIKTYRSQIQVTEHAQDKWKGRTITSDQGDLYGHLPQGGAYTDKDGTRRAPLLLGGGKDAPARGGNPARIRRAHQTSKMLRRRRDEVFPELRGVPPSREWAGPLGFTPDRLPGIGLLRPGVIVAAGFSGYGGTYTQAAGQAAAIIALTGKAPDWAPQDVFGPRRLLPGGAQAPALGNPPAALDGLGVPPDAAPSEAPRRSVNSFWTGFETDEWAPSASEQAAALDDSDAGTAAPWLALKDKRRAFALDRAIELARTTKAGRRALDAAEAVLAAQGRALTVEVKNLGRNYGEYDYLDDKMSLHEKLFEPGHEAELAGTLTHELVHLVQHAAGLPSNALELEIEAHLQDLELMAELGLETKPNTFARQTADALKQGPKAFVEMIQRAVPGSPYLGESSMADIIDQLEEELDGLRAKRSARAAKLAEVIEGDIASLRTKKGAAAYRAFSKRVRDLLKRRASGL